MVLESQTCFLFSQFLNPRSSFGSLTNARFHYQKGNQMRWIRKMIISASNHCREPIFQQHANDYAKCRVVRSILSTMVRPYMEKNATAVAAMELIRREEGGPIHFDHFAFRTFGVSGLGIPSLSQVFLELGYKQRDELLFPSKKLRAYWFSPPEGDKPDLNGDGTNGPLPRIFISELLLEHLSDNAQDIVRSYTNEAISLAKYTAIVGGTPWPKPRLEHYKQLARESEYAAWTLVNGYALNHATVSVHHLKSRLRNIKFLNDFLLANGFRLNAEGGSLKVSPDGGLLQSSTVADSVPFCFTEGVTENIPASYIEFAKRLVLPEFKFLPPNQIEEHHRREGFEVGNADKIFESTYVSASQ